MLLTHLLLWRRGSRLLLTFGSALLFYLLPRLVLLNLFCGRLATGTLRLSFSFPLLFHLLARLLLARGGLLLSHGLTLLRLLPQLLELGLSCGVLARAPGSLLLPLSLTQLLQLLPRLPRLNLLLGRCPRLLRFGGETLW